MDLTRERGSSSWLTALPLEEHGFPLHKGAFADALALRYGWAPSRTQTSCACGANFTVEHVLSCPRGGFPSIRHNEIRDITANLLSKVCKNTTIEKCFRRHKLEKKRAYCQHVREIEHASFTPLVLSASVGLTKEATNFYKRLASLLADKWDQPYSQTMNWLRCRISFALLHSAIQCGARSSCGHAIRSPVDLVTAETHINHL